MSENRRSTEVILRSAYSVISRNPRDHQRRVARRRAVGTRTVARPHAKASRSPPAGADSRHGTTRLRSGICGPGNRPYAATPKGGRGAISPCSTAVIRTAMRWWSNSWSEASRLHVKGLDLLETAEVRDLLAALRAIDGGDPVGLLRVSALPKFKRRWRGASRGAGGSRKEAADLEAVAGQSGRWVGRHHGACRSAPRHRSGLQNKALAACGIVQKHFGIAAHRIPRPSRSLCKAGAASRARSRATARCSEFLEYLDYFIEGERARSVRPRRRTSETPATLQMEIGSARDRSDRTTRCGC